jgi:hypothetical protein
MIRAALGQRHVIHKRCCIAMEVREPFCDPATVCID